jgi:hypothetical protein
MDRCNQHRKNAAIERTFMTEAANDEHYLGARAQELRGRGQVARANFMHHEAVIAGSFKDKRRQILNREIRLSHPSKR